MAANSHYDLTHHLYRDYDLVEEQVARLDAWEQQLRDLSLAPKTALNYLLDVRAFLIWLKGPTPLQLLRTDI